MIYLHMPAASRAAAAVPCLKKAAGSHAPGPQLPGTSGPCSKTAVAGPVPLGPDPAPTGAAAAVLLHGTN